MIFVLDTVSVAVPSYPFPREVSRKNIKYDWCVSNSQRTKCLKVVQYQKTRKQGTDIFAEYFL